MKKFIILLGVISSSLIAMDKQKLNIIKKICQLSGVKFIQVSTNSKIFNNYNHKMIHDLSTIYRAYLEDIKRRDVKFCMHKKFRLRMPSFYVQQFQEKQFVDIKNGKSSLRGLGFFFSADEYFRMDKHFAQLYKKHKDVKKTWDEFIEYFLADHVAKPLVGKKYAKMPSVIPTY